MKNTKIPKLFRKQYSSKTLNKKILKRIHIPKDRKMVSDLFVENSSGKMELKDDLPEKTRAKLKTLSKSIKKNKGFIKTWKASVVLVLIAVLLVFNLFFKDALLKRAVESGLESVFNAQVSIEKPHLSLFKGIITFDSLSIADSDKPMYNLIETGKAQLEISISELTGKRVRIEEMLLEKVMWNTARSEDGSLSAESSGAGNSAVMEKEGLTSSLALNPEDIDFQSLIDEQKNNLSSLNLIEESNEKIKALETRWSSDLEEMKNEIDGLSAKINTVKSLNPTNIGSIEDAQLMINQVNDLYSELEPLKQRVSSAGNDMIGEKENLAALTGSISTSIEDDIAYLEGFLNISTGDMGSIASGLAENYIRNRWNSYYEYGLKALKIYRRFQDREKKESKEKKGLRRDSGRNVIFPSTEKPQFLINHIKISGGDHNTGNLQMEISSITSEPDLIKNPLTFEAHLKKGNSSLNLDGTVDLKTDSEELFRMDIHSPENPVHLEQGFPALSINEISGQADFTGLSVILPKGSVVTTSFDMTINDLMIIHDKSESLLSKTLSDLLSSQKNVDFKGEVSISTEGIENISIDTGLDDLLTNSVGGYLDNLNGSMSGELRANLLKYLSPELDSNDKLMSSLDLLGAQSLDQVKSVNNLEKILDDKKNELNNKADSITGELKESVLEKAKDVIKLPGF